MRSRTDRYRTRSTPQLHELWAILYRTPPYLTVPTDPNLHLFFRLQAGGAPTTDVSTMMTDDDRGYLVRRLPQHPPMSPA